jgi:uncharacterized membrane protein
MDDDRRRTAIAAFALAAAIAIVLAMFLTIKTIDRNEKLDATTTGLAKARQAPYRASGEQARE